MAGIRNPCNLRDLQAMVARPKRIGYKVHVPGYIHGDGKSLPLTADEISR